MQIFSPRPTRMQLRNVNYPGKDTRIVEVRASAPANKNTLSIVDSAHFLLHQQHSLI